MAARLESGKDFGSIGQIRAPELFERTEEKKKENRCAVLGAVSHVP
jgi:hypothetical protein